MGIPHHHSTGKAKRVITTGAVDGLNMTKLETSIQWIGKVRLHLLNEDSDSMLSDTEWPIQSGRMFYGCASTGLLFDKQSGRCLQSSNVSLLLDTLQEVECTKAKFMKWREARIAGGAATKHITLKRGPKPKGYVAPEYEDGDF